MKKIAGEKFAYELERWSVLLILGLVMVFMLALTASAYLETSYLNTNDISGENIDIYSDNVFLNLILLVIYLSVAYLFYHCTDAIPKRYFELLLFGWVFCFGSVFIGTTKLAPPIYSDSFMLINAAIDASDGFYHNMPTYFSRFPFQLGYVLYAEVFLRVMFVVLPGLPEGYYVLGLQFINLVWLMLCYYSLLCITRCLWDDERVHKLCMLLMFFSLQPMMSCTFLYGNIPALACGTVAVWMFLKFMQEDKLRFALLCVLFLTAAVALKLNLMIFLVAIGALWLVKLVKKFSLKSCLCLVLAAVCALTLSKIPQAVYEKRSGYEFGEGIPMVAWLAMGMSEGHAAAGWYKEDHTVTAFKESGNDPDLTGEKAKTAIAERLGFFGENPREAMSFFAEKLRSQWNEPSYDSIWLNQVFTSYSEKGGIYSLLCDKGERLTVGFMNQHQQLVFLGMLMGIIALVRKRDILSCILPLIILGGLMYHLLFEAKSQYALPYFILMMPVAAMGLSAFFEGLKKHVS